MRASIKIASVILLILILAGTMFVWSRRAPKFALYGQVRYHGSAFDGSLAVYSVPPDYWPELTKLVQKARAEQLTYSGFSDMLDRSRIHIETHGNVEYDGTAYRYACQVTPGHKLLISIDKEPGKWAESFTVESDRRLDLTEENAFAGETPL